MSRNQKIVVTQGGPYTVSGAVPLTIQVIKPNKQGLWWDWEEPTGELSCQRQ